MTNNKTIIQIVGDCVYWGGREQHILELCKGFTEREYQVLTILRSHSTLEQHFAPVSKVVKIPLRNSIDLGSIFQLAWLLFRHKVDIVHTHSSRDLSLALLASKLSGRGKVFLTRHIVTPLKGDCYHRWMYRNLEHIICPSQMVQTQLLESAPYIPSAKPVVVYNGIDTSRYSCNGNNMRQESDPFIIGYVGRISEEKGIEYLIRALRLVVDAGIQAKLRIVGDGSQSYRNLLTSEVTRLALQEYVEFNGFSHHIPDTMRGLDVVVLPCLWQEVFGLVLCEAMACQRPVITTTNGAQREIVIDGETGYLVPDRNEQVLAERLLELARNPLQRKKMGEQGRLRVEQYFSTTRMLDQLESLFFD